MSGTRAIRRQHQNVADKPFIVIWESSPTAPPGTRPAAARITGADQETGAHRDSPPAADGRPEDKTRPWARVIRSAVGDGRPSSCVLRRPKVEDLRKAPHTTAAPHGS